MSKNYKSKEVKPGFSVKLADIVNGLDLFFEVKDLKTDPSMSHFVPLVYKNKQDDFKFFTPTFKKHFNGLMIKGGNKVGRIFVSAFPHDEILKKFINQSNSGDLLFLHHPIILECGDPKGKLGNGFMPIKSSLLSQIIKKNLSIYACHAPLDYNKKISTNIAIANSIGGKIKSRFLPYGNGMAGLIVDVEPTSTDELIKKLKNIFDISYVESAGEKKEIITRIGIVAGGGDDMEYSMISKKKGAQAYITGEIFSHQKNEWAKENTIKIQEYAKSIDISLLGVSHSASEFLVMKTQMPNWFMNNFKLETELLTQVKWWI